MKKWKMTPWICLIATIFFLTTLSSAAGATATSQIVVKTIEDDAIPNGNCTLREAILAANSDMPVDACQAGSGDDVILLPAGVYSLTVVGSNEDLGITGDLDISASVTIRGQGSDVSIIQGFIDTLYDTDRDRSIHILPGAGIVKLHHLALNNSPALMNGKAVFNEAQLILEDCVLSNNSSGDFDGFRGGGINNAGTLELRRCQLSHNQATYGGAIFNAGNATIEETNFLNNAADDDSYAGGIYNDGDLTITGSTFNGNFSGVGAAIYNRANLVVLDSHLDHNNSRFVAGALGNTGMARLENITANQNGTGHAVGAISNSGTLILTHSTIAGNLSYDYAGAIYQSSGHMTIEDTDISGNQTDGDGGAIFVSGGQASLIRATLKENISRYDDGGAIYLSAGELILQDSVLEGNEAKLAGGGVFALGGSVTLERSEIIKNKTGQNGGGIFQEAGRLQLRDSQVNQNYAANHGGGIFSYAELDIQQSEINQNEIERDGAGIYLTGSLSLVNSTISRNNGYGTGGGIYNEGRLVALRSRVVGNWGWAFSSSGVDGGGGIYNLGAAEIQECEIGGNFTIADGGGIANAGSLVLRNSTVSGNWGRSWAGGLKQSDGGTSNIENVTFTYNQGDLGGGGVGIAGGTASLNHVTIFNNIDAIGFLGNIGGALEVSNSGALTIQNTLVAGNKVYGEGPLQPTVDCNLWPGASVTNLGYNLIGIVDGCNWTSAPGDLTGTLSNILDARLFNLGPFGGLTKTTPPKFGSPAMDAANPVSCLPADQRGIHRPQGGGCDIGAVEAIQIDAAIDIKPNSFSNVIDRNSSHRVTVVVFSTQLFDASNQLDQTTLTFGHTGNEASLFHTRGKIACFPRDINQDGMPDLVCEFVIAHTGFQCGDSIGILRAYGFQKELIEGQDRVRIVPCP